MTYRGNNVGLLDSVSSTLIINISIGSGGSGWVSRVWQSQYGTLDMSRYNIMWCYMLSILTYDRIKKITQGIVILISLHEGNKKEGRHKWHSLYGWLGARKTCPSALAIDLCLSCINPSISSLAWVCWVKTRKYGEHSSLLCENAVLVNMADRGYSLPAGISVGMRPANERRRYNVKTFLIGWAHT